MNTNPPGGKGEVFNIRTDNILFVFTGAFIGLHKMILDRISKGSIGFGAPVRASNPNSGPHDTMLKGEDALFKKHLPFFVPPPTPARSTPFGKVPNASPQPSSPPQTLYNTLDLVEPADLQKYGMIPELVGRIPISCALSALDEEALVRVLTEPRNSLLRQYEQLFQLSGIELRFTSGALKEVARAAGGMGTGARGLRTVLERLLGESMFETPGELYPRSSLCTATPAVLFYSCGRMLPWSVLLMMCRVADQAHPHHAAGRPAQTTPDLPPARPAAQVPCADRAGRGGVGGTDAGEGERGRLR